MKRFVCASVLISSTFLLTSCTIPPGGFKFAQIHYSQLGACTHAQLADGSVVDAPASHAIVLFRVNNVDNSAPPLSWTFDLKKLQVNSPSDPQTNLGSDSPPIAIGANSNVTVNRPIGIMVETSRADGTDAAGVKFTLLYPNVPPAPGTLGVNDTLSSPGFPFKANCTSLITG